MEGEVKDYCEFEYGLKEHTSIMVYNNGDFSCS